MGKERFVEPDKDYRVIKNTKTGETATYYDTEDGLMFLKWLNNLSNENEKLKSENKILKQDLEHCANQFNDDGKNVLLGLK